jgi:hypothetical protein
VALTGRPVGIDAKIVKKTDETVEAGKMARVTPMDKVWAN